MSNTPTNDDIQKLAIPLKVLEESGIIIRCGNITAVPHIDLTVFEQTQETSK